MIYDAVIIGAGHNGLVTACYLAKAGMKVCVVEKNDWVGGAAVSRELYPGFTYSNCSYVSSLFRPEIMRDLELPKHGLQILPYEGGAVFMEDGDYLGMFRDHDANRREFARHSKRDAEAYDRYSRDILRHCRFIRPLLMRTPPDPSSFRPRDLSELAYLGRTLFDLSEAQICDMIRFWTMSISDYLDEYFEHPVIKAYMAVSAIIGTALGPMSPGSAYVLLHHYMGDVDGNVGAWGYARGGMGSITQALAKSLASYGGEIRTGKGVEKIVVSGGKATGVVLEDGDEMSARRVISNMDVKRTFLKHVEERELPDGFVKRVRSIQDPGIVGQAEHRAGRGAELYRDAQRARRCSRAICTSPIRSSGWSGPMTTGRPGHFSRDPFQDMMIPTMIDPTMTPPGKHFMSCFVQYAPPRIEGRDWTDADRDAFGRTCIDQIEAHAPGLQGSDPACRGADPARAGGRGRPDRRQHLPGRADLRPAAVQPAGSGLCATTVQPIRDLWICGSSTHPGGGVMGAPGRNAAAEMLRDVKLGTKGMSDAYAVL